MVAKAIRPRLASGGRATGGATRGGRWPVARQSAPVPAGHPDGTYWDDALLAPGLRQLANLTSPGTDEG